MSRRSMLAASTMALGLMCLDASPAGAQSDATDPSGAATIFHGGTILTVDRDFSTPEAIAIRGNRIVSVGSLADVEAAAGQGAIRIDLAGRTLMPGFVEAHTHALSGAVIDLMCVYVGMARFRKTDDVLALLKKEAAAAAPGDWIVARNWDPSIQEGPAALTFAELDAVSTANPVLVLNASLHLGYANRAAFAAAKIPDDIKNPPGAEFSRDAEGKLTGVMKNNIAFMKVLGANPALAKVDPVAAVGRLAKRFNTVGITTFSDLGLGGLTQGAGDWAILKGYSATGTATARVRAYPIYTVEQSWIDSGVKPMEGDDIVQLVGFKLISDGSNQGFTGLQREPYLGTDNFGLAYLPPEQLTELAQRWAGKGWQLSVHANGDAAIDNTLAAFRHLKEQGINLAEIRPRIEHCSILHDEQIAQMKELGVSPSFLIGHVYFWGIAMRDKIFGPQKALLLGRCASVEKAGIGFTIHSDFTVSDPEPLAMMQMAVTRRTWADPDFVLAPDERIGIVSAIRALTSEAAWQLGSDHQIGSLEPGKFADLVVLEKDPRQVDAEQIGSIAVVETWFDGKQVFAA
ncbi:MAG: amidohydrolase family protein [Hyphomicrobiales bacterium]|nr:amidohydrolase family protein [Hyphomicrobiales bacterium]